MVVTGASSGIGRATARRFARQGAQLVICARSDAALQTVAKECRDLGGQVLVVPADVSDESAMVGLADAAVAAFGRIDVWVGNAGVFAYGTFEQLPSDVFRQVIETNLMGQIHGARAVLPHFRRQGAGSLVLVGSLYSRASSPTISPYVTSKYATLGFAESLRQELRGSGIRVHLVLPASIDTPIYQHAANFTGRLVRPLPPVSSAGRVARAIARAPGRRRFVTFVGRTQKAALLVHDFAPGLHGSAARWLMKHVELHGRAPSASTGNVFESTGSAGQVSGGWRAIGLRLLLAAAGAAVLLRRLSR
ncbi:3-oxoacyl-ACP reductase [Actinomycetales bacterium SN12]|nr:3-oxoacyl-ACP reductase [Actinomycetales bacterium SN12]